MDVRKILSGNSFPPPLNKNSKDRVVLRIKRIDNVLRFLVHISIYDKRLINDASQKEKRMIK